MEFFVLTIGTIMFIAGYLWTGFDALKHDPEYGKWAFLSGMYRVNYCRANWHRTKLPCSMTILGLLLFFIGMII